MTNSSNRLFINISNHPTKLWLPDQLEASKSFGDVIDWPFPQVKPDATEEDIKELANNTVQQVLNTYNNTNISVHIMGEFNLSYSLIRRFQKHGVNCYASTTKRIVEEISSIEKISTFKFIQFRKYENLIVC